MAKRQRRQQEEPLSRQIVVAEGKTHTVIAHATITPAPIAEGVAVDVRLGIAAYAKQARIFRPTPTDET